MKYNPFKMWWARTRYCATPDFLTGLSLLVLNIFMLSVFYKGLDLNLIYLNSVINCVIVYLILQFLSFVRMCLMVLLYFRRSSEKRDEEYQHIISKGYAKK